MTALEFPQAAHQAPWFPWEHPRTREAAHRPQVSPPVLLRPTFQPPRKSLWMSPPGTQRNHSFRGLFPECRAKLSLVREVFEKKHNAASKRNCIATGRKNVSLATRKRRWFGERAGSLALQGGGGGCPEDKVWTSEMVSYKRTISDQLRELVRTFSRCLLLLPCQPFPIFI